MTKIKIEQLIWDKWNTEHIKKHDVSREEVEEVIENVIAHRKGYDGRVILIGRSGKRIISIIIAKEKSGNYYIPTARDADRKERKLVYEKEKEQNSKV
ncbi:MAG: hypothetical protein A3D24_03745 [Candidatus Blackburnbacteria bacterium RIFCSPHIGHO2_02_FULL_39_13]|uniref:Toxin n=1 Tax=Candidatus Blackburnbacteria bacterium RIFCSPLOWO2_01_FULL_40_20 TaxID=1797519 RepID=A0A1G1VCP9_9BACT|nr:MAG: hypothetical protein UT38_C0011G0034 [Microgenomates group bacterium GW2011_GWA2_39_19]OGY06993.1 MAG: hypothetical protein A2694_03710 [Candidatus Blackburnbacteria bacterium RIFCSPHIGHO2_01_FULL_40_17]OGY08506.1 MAG: hypothetical protein A3D24_03745 [Candidatus Blackburnbacteria bacterium RIFCSPHIGHO2_02_FULL_39_13]OGY13273.1 MAG: hypothetical protein A3A77_02480 [Candidatus Blackburnbacteria bacterium RIFCSPLOWO2_01_FULL_40_20]OGY15596.1 MAG: hypothetical protein A3I52_00795 [Candida